MSRGDDSRISTPHDCMMVTACGRSVQVPLKDAQSVSMVKEVLQRELKMHGQEFELYDNVGTVLMTDGDLRSALQSGAGPFTATLSEASIHYIENRREELAQMQWKLLRDKVDGLSGKVNLISQQMQAMNDAFASQRVEQQEGDRRLHADIEVCMEDAKEQTRQLGAQLAERVEAVSQIVHSERNMREALKEGIIRQVQGVRDALEADRMTRRTESASTHTLIDDIRRAVQDEGRARESLEDRHHQDLLSLQDRIDTLSRYQAESKQEMEGYMKHLTTGANQELEDHNRQVLQLRSGMESAQIEVSTRFQKMEDKHLSVENRLQEHSSRHATQFNQLWTKTQGLSNTVESVRLKDRAINGPSGAQGVGPNHNLSRVEELEHDPMPISAGPSISEAGHRSNAGSLQAPPGYPQAQMGPAGIMQMRAPASNLSPGPQRPGATSMVGHSPNGPIVVNPTSVLRNQTPLGYVSMRR